jgi:sec-independent protein translocase protein TatC
MTEEPDPFEHTRMTLGEHLEELRKRLLKSAFVFVLAFVVAWALRVRIADVMLGPYRDVADRLNGYLAEIYAERVDVQGQPWERYWTSADPATRALLRPIESRPLVTGIGEEFGFALNNSVWFALFVGSPFFLWQMWQFIAAGLYPHEKRGIRVAFPFSLALFLAGVLFAFLAIVPLGMYFLQLTLDPDQVSTSLKLDTYFGFVRALCLGMGVVFQLPVLMVFAMRVGVITPATFARYRGHWVVGALLIAALLTPGPDFYSQILMAIPMIGLYEVGILLGRIVARPRRSPSEAREARA